MGLVTRVAIEIKLLTSNLIFFLEILEVLVSVEYKIMTTQDKQANLSHAFLDVWGWAALSGLL